MMLYTSTELTKNHITTNTKLTDLIEISNTNNNTKTIHFTMINSNSYIFKNIIFYKLRTSPLLIGLITCILNLFIIFIIDYILKKQYFTNILNIENMYISMFIQMIVAVILFILVFILITYPVIILNCFEVKFDDFYTIIKQMSIDEKINLEVLINKPFISDIFKLFVEKISNDISENIPNLYIQYQQYLQQTTSKWIYIKNYILHIFLILILYLLSQCIFIYVETSKSQNTSQQNKPYKPLIPSKIQLLLYNHIYIFICVYILYYHFAIREMPIWLKAFKTII